MTEVAILGAGLTGLSAAYHLEKKDFHNFKIFEKNSSCGGLLRSFKQDGFTFDYTGHLLHISDPYFFDFLNNIAGINNFFIQNRSSYIYTNNKNIPYPFQSNLYGLPKNIISECINGFIKRKQHIKNPENFYEWVLKYFGAGIGKHFFFPYNTKLLSYDLKKITPSWTGRFVPKTDLKTILESAKDENKNNIGYNSEFYYPKNGGIQFLIEKLETKLKTTVLKNHNATKIDLKNKIITFENGHTEKFKKLITTMPLNNLLLKIDEKTNSNLKNQHKNLLCNTVINFNLGFNKSVIKNKHWIYFPETKYNFYRLGSWSNINKNSAPENHSSIYGEYSYLPNKSIKKDTTKLTEKSISQALQFLKLEKQNIISKKILKLSHAYVIYDHWREKNLKSLHKRLNDLELYSIGRFGEWKYSSMQEAVIDGKNIVDKILQQYKFTPAQRIGSNIQRKVIVSNEKPKKILQR